MAPRTERLEENEEVPSLPGSLPRQTPEHNPPAAATIRVLTTIRKPVAMETKVPPDGGWGWAVLIGTMTVNIVLIGHAKSFGVYFTSVMQLYDALPSRVAWVQAIQLAIFSFLAPLSSVLSQLYGPRTVALTGTALACFGLLLSSVAPNLVAIYIFYGVLQGLALTCTFTPGIMMIGRYFNKRRGLANGLGMAGNAIGGIVMPLVANALTVEYGLKGAWWVMAGILLNACVGVMLWQPIEWHLKTVPAPEEESNSQDPTSSDSDLVGELQVTRASRPIYMPRAASVDELALSHVMARKGLARENSYHEVRDRLMIPFPYQKLSPQILSVHSADTLPSLSRLAVRSRSLRKNSATSSFIYMSTFELGPPPVLANGYIPESEESPQKKNSLQMTEIKKKKRFSCPKFPTRLLDTSVLGNNLFQVLTCSLTLHFLGYPGTQIYLPYRCTMLGLTKSHTASLLSLLAFTDLMGRVVCGWLSDFHICPRKYWFIGGMFVSGLCSFCLQFCTDYPSLIVGSSAFGFASGAYIGLVVVMFADVFGGEQVAAVYSLASVFGGIMALAGPPLIGHILEATGSYGTCQTILATAQLLGGAVWAFEPSAARREKLKQQRKLVHGDVAGV